MDLHYFDSIQLPYISNSSKFDSKTHLKFNHTTRLSYNKFPQKEKNIISGLKIDLIFALLYGTLFVFKIKTS